MFDDIHLFSIVVVFTKEKTSALSDIEVLKEEVQHHKEEINNKATEKVNIMVVFTLQSIEW